MSRALISIHLMFLLIDYQSSATSLVRNFNTSHVSINLMVWATCSSLLTDFNTSHVSINLALSSRRRQIRPYFNTSHVSINLWKYARYFWCRRNFNTSHVSINHKYANRVESGEISIHLMFLLIDNRRTD